MRFPELIGLELDKHAEGGPVFWLEIDERHRQVNDVVHGSVLHALLDMAMGLQCFRAAGRQPVGTVEISVRYLRPVSEGRLESRATVLRTGKRLLTVEGTVTCAGELIAVGQATFSVL